MAGFVFSGWGGWTIVILVALGFPLIQRGVAPVNLVTEVIILGLFATAYNLVLGYGGLISFGHAAFFGLGAYTLAIFLVRLSLPLWLGFIIAPIVSVLVGAVFGFFATRAAHMFVGFLTLSFAQMIWAIFYKFPYIGSVDGIWSVPIGEAFYSPIIFYYFTVGIAGVCFVLLYLIVKSPFGLVLQSIRDNRMRSEFIGLNHKSYQIVAFAISAFFCSIAGVLYCMLNRGAYPDLLNWVTTGNAMIMTLIGGMYSFTGPLLGAGIMVVLSDFAIKKTIYWPLIMGAIVILIVLLFPGGIAEHVGKVLTKVYYKRGHNDVA
jgi:branched-chain amino acid transport system permease protein